MLKCKSRRQRKKSLSICTHPRQKRILRFNPLVLSFFVPSLHVFVRLHVIFCGKGVCGPFGAKNRALEQDHHNKHGLLSLFSGAVKNSFYDSPSVVPSLQWSKRDPRSREIEFWCKEKNKENRNRFRSITNVQSIIYIAQMMNCLD